MLLQNYFLLPFPIGYDDIDSLLELASIKNLSSTNDFFLLLQFAHHSAAIIAQNLSIPYPSRVSIDICLDKTKLYTYCHKQNIPILKPIFISDRSQLLSLLPSLDASSNII